MENITISTNRERACRERVLAVLEANNGAAAVKDFIVQQGAIRLENVITTRTEYSFNLFESQGTGTQTPTEIKLNRNDAFFVSDIALLIAKEVTGASAVPLANTRLWSFPDAVTFSGTGEVAALEAFYNAKLTFQTVPVSRLQAFDTNVFRFQPPTRVSATAANTWGPSQAERGYFPLSGEIILDGSQDNIINISLASNASIAAAAGLTNQQNILLVKLYGHRVINGAQKVGLFMN